MQTAANGCEHQSSSQSNRSKSGSTAVDQIFPFDLRPTATCEASFSLAESKVTRWTESLVDEQICSSNQHFGGFLLVFAGVVWSTVRYGWHVWPGVGSPMMPCEIHAREPGVQSVLAALHSTLSLGLGYVSSQGTSISLGYGVGRRGTCSRICQTDQAMAPNLRSWWLCWIGCVHPCRFMRSRQGYVLFSRLYVQNLAQEP